MDIHTIGIPDGVFDHDVAGLISSEQHSKNIEHVKKGISAAVADLLLTDTLAIFTAESQANVLRQIVSAVELLSKRLPENIFIKRIVHIITFNRQAVDKVFADLREVQQITNDSMCGLFNIVFLGDIPSFDTAAVKVIADPDRGAKVHAYMAANGLPHERVLVTSQGGLYDYVSQAGGQAAMVYHGPGRAPEYEEALLTQLTQAIASQRT